jgi:DNA-3-methyladenine glycosylase II
VISTFNKDNFSTYCDRLASTDRDLANIIRRFGYPPLWNRKQNFETLIHIILEQQVSLASAKAALEKLKQKIGKVLPEQLILLTDEEMRSCFFSRQKSVYAKGLANEILAKRFSLRGLKNLGDEDARTSMKKIKGIGDWTADVYLMMALQRTDCFPTGDIALIKSIRQVKRMADDCSKEKVLAVAEKWRPHRTIAAYLLWHNYLSNRNQKS